MGDKCRFCEALEIYRRIQKIDPQKRIYSVAIVKRTFIDGERKARSSMTDYNHGGCGYKLKYCPECGKRIKPPVNQRGGEQ